VANRYLLACLLARNRSSCSNLFLADFHGHVGSRYNVLTNDSCSLQHSKKWYSRTMPSCEIANVGVNDPRLRAPQPASRAGKYAYSFLPPKELTIVRVADHMMQARSYEVTDSAKAEVLYVIRQLTGKQASMCRRHTRRSHHIMQCSNASFFFVFFYITRPVQ
jgi:hypothetical protein